MPTHPHVNLSDPVQQHRTDQRTLDRELPYRQRFTALSVGTVDGVSGINAAGSSVLIAVRIFILTQTQAIIAARAAGLAATVA
jgi:hypothetical protein